jgi:hypothetical protein
MSSSLYKEQELAWKTYHSSTGSHLYEESSDRAWSGDCGGKSGVSIRSGRRIEKGVRVEKSQRQWRTRQDPFALVWEAELVPLLYREPELTGTTLWEYLDDRYPGQYPEKLLKACSAV